MYSNKHSQQSPAHERTQRENHQSESRQPLPILPGIKDADWQVLTLDLSPELISKLRSYA